MGKEDAAPVLCWWQGQAFSSVSAKLSEHFTPTQSYTEDTLLSAMEAAGKSGIRRAGTREKKRSRYSATCSHSGKSGWKRFCGAPRQAGAPSHKGWDQSGSSYAGRVTSPKLTAEWENTLIQIERGQASADDFMARDRRHDYGAGKDYSFHLRG
jgi:DNA topoisomerase-3